MERGAGMEVFFIPCRKRFTPPRRRRRVRYMETFIIPKQNKSPPY